jgi:EAL domain-containing protein (putative c-di-GMP-specific phosphodiesterase class I)
MEEGELLLRYQPVVDSRNSRVVSFEALIRWKNPILGDIPPLKFIPIAEETGLIPKIGDWVLRTACTEAVQWPESISIAVNVSPRQLQDPGFVLGLVSALSQSGLAPERLELEITETVFLNVTPATQRVLQQIRSLGVRLAMDDFGTGYSSLGYLREFDFDTLKIDRSFIEKVKKDDVGSGAIVKAVVALAGSLAMKTVAEGVETEEQLEVIRTLGCDRIQGFVISEALLAADARAFIADGKCRAAA